MALKAVEGNRPYRECNPLHMHERVFRKNKARENRGPVFSAERADDVCVFQW